MISQEYRIVLSSFYHYYNYIFNCMYVCIKCIHYTHYISEFQLKNVVRKLLKIDNRLSRSFFFVLQREKRLDHATTRLVGGSMTLNLVIHTQTRTQCRYESRCGSRLSERRDGDQCRWRTGQLPEEKSFPRS